MDDTRTILDGAIIIQIEIPSSACGASVRGTDPPCAYFFAGAAERGETAPQFYKQKERRIAQIARRLKGEP
jgi:hypothetical protein